MAYSAHPSRAKQVPILISSGGDKKTFTVDQTKPLPSGHHFRPVGTVDLQGDVQTVIQITNAGTSGFVILDALQLLRFESKTKTKEERIAAASRMCIAQSFQGLRRRMHEVESEPALSLSSGS